MMPSHSSPGFDHCRHKGTSDGLGAAAMVDALVAVVPTSVVDNDIIRLVVIYKIFLVVNTAT